MKIHNIVEKLKLVCGICALFGWWGFLYPELSVTMDCCRVVESEAPKREVPECEAPDSKAAFSSGQGADKYWQNTTYWSLLEAGPENIQFRSRLLEELGFYEEEE